MGNRYPPWSIGGYEVVWQAAVQALRGAGHPARVLTTLPDPSDRPHDGPADPDVHRDLRWYWRDHAFPKLTLRDCVSLERHNAFTLRRHLQQFAPDVVLWWAMGGMSLSLLEQVRRAGVPALGVVGDEWMLYGPRVDAWTRRWRRPLGPGARLAERATGVPARLDLDRAARWAFNSPHLLTLARGDGWQLPEARILPPGVDLRRFSTRAPEPWGWRLLYLGRLDPRKGIATAIDALGLLPATATLRIHGEGSPQELDELRSRAARLGVADRVRFTHSGHDAVPEVLGEADAVVFPVRWREPWGLVPLEAMAVGRPVVASRAGGGPSEYLNDGENCLQFDAGDAAGMARAIHRLAAEPGFRAELLAGGRETVSRFSESAFHTAVEAELRDLTGASGL
ncbi:MAG: D-inositol-3-phosphate glycosyltransferase [Solirubrobacteraceae bacterium]|nr:D-inositol-3-phosphate glycosyltransferase [Solirubrobacteraceae bacterium]